MYKLPLYLLFFLFLINNNLFSFLYFESDKQYLKEKEELFIIIGINEFDQFLPSNSKLNCEIIYLINSKLSKKKIAIYNDMGLLIEYIDGNIKWELDYNSDKAISKLKKTTNNKIDFFCTYEYVNSTISVISKFDSNNNIIDKYTFEYLFNKKNKLLSRTMKNNKKQKIYYCIYNYYELIKTEEFFSPMYNKSLIKKYSYDIFKNLKKIKINDINNEYNNIYNSYYEEYYYNKKNIITTKYIIDNNDKTLKKIIYNENGLISEIINYESIEINVPINSYERYIQFNGSQSKAFYDDFNVIKKIDEKHFYLKEYRQYGALYSYFEKVTISQEIDFKYFE